MGETADSGTIVKKNNTVYSGGDIQNTFVALSIPFHVETENQIRASRNKNITRAFRFILPAY